MKVSIGNERICDHAELTKWSISLGEYAQGGSARL